MVTPAAVLLVFKFKIIITLRRAQKFGDTGPYKNFDFLYNPLVPEFFAILAKIYCPTFGDARHKWVNSIAVFVGMKRQICLILRR